MMYIHTKEMVAAYEKATLQSLGNPDETRWDVIYRAMDIYATEMYLKLSGEINQLKEENERMKKAIAWIDNHV